MASAVLAASFQGLDFNPVAISANGLVVVGQGYNSTESAFDAVRWTAAGGTLDLGDLPGGSFNSGARAGSADGSVVVGSAISADSDPTFESFRWSQASGMVALGTLAGGTHNSYAAGVSADGSV